MNLSNDDLEICVKIGENIVHNFSDSINEQSIIENATKIEEILLKNRAEPKKVQDVYEISIELMQNILNYSYGAIDLGNNKREGYGTLQIFYALDGCYRITTSNLIENNIEDIIVNKINQLDGLDKKALRKLAREKMRSKKDVHEKGAGLGFINIAKKSLKPMEMSFRKNSENLTLFTLEVFI